MRNRKADHCNKILALRALQAHNPGNLLIRYLIPLFPVKAINKFEKTNAQNLCLSFHSHSYYSPLSTSLLRLRFST